MTNSSRSKEWGIKIGNAHKKSGLKPPSRKGIKWSKEAIAKRTETRMGYKHSLETLRKMSECHKGSKCYLWRGGLTEKNKAIRASLEYKLWRKSVFERDGYTCVWCKTKGGRLNADHIKEFSDYPELRFAIDNGRTLCVECHTKTENYGWKLRWFKKAVL